MMTLFLVLTSKASTSSSVTNPEPPKSDDDFVPNPLMSQIVTSTFSIN